MAPLRETSTPPTSVFLLGEEDRVTREITAQLREMGLQLRGHASRAGDALQEVPRIRPDLVLILRPLEGEPEWLETVRTLRERVDTPIVLLTDPARGGLPEPIPGPGLPIPVVDPGNHEELRAVIALSLRRHALTQALNEVDARLRAPFRKGNGFRHPNDVPVRFRRQSDALDRAVRLLSSRLAFARGMELYEGVASALPGILKTEIAFVVRSDPMDPDHPRILAWVEDGILRGEGAVSLAGTPCAGALGAGETVITSGLHLEFPESKLIRERSLASWASVPLQSPFGGVMGHVGVVGRHPLPAPEQTRLILRLFGAHLSNELARDSGEQRFLRLLDLAPDAILMADVRGRIVLANRQAVQLFGWTEEELLGEAIDSVLPHEFDVLGSPEEHGRGDDAPEGPSLGWGLSATPARGDLWGVRKNGERFPAAVGLAGIPGGEGGVIAIVRSLEGTREAEAQLAAARASFLDAFQSINEGVILWDEEDRVAVANQRALEFLPDLRTELASGARFKELVATMLDQGLLSIPDGMDPKEFILRQIARHRRADGTEIVVRLPGGRIWSITTLPSRRGGRVTVVADITGRVQAEENFRRVQKMEALGKLTGGLAHDFNNYLGVIYGYLEMLQEDPSLGELARRRVGVAMQAATRGAELTRSLLSFARRQPRSPRITEVSEVVGETVELLRQILGRDVRVRVEVSPEPHTVRVDPEQLGSALMNLANNARDAMPDGGELVVRVRNAFLGRGHKLLHPYARAGSYVLLEVADSGVGMSEETRAMAFEPFFSTKGPGHGTGLGLSMVYGFVKQSGGHVEILSRPGEGTALRIYLPHLPDEALPTAEVPRSKGGDGLPRGEETLLVVEDNPDVRETVTLQAASLGYRVLSAEDGDAALRILEDAGEVTHLLFTDLVLPGGMDGKELSRRVRERNPGIRVLFTSGFSPENLSNELNLGPGQRLLSKPYRKAELALAIRQTLDGWSGPPAPEGSGDPPSGE
ncbi:MAG: response regulator [Gemmatimonadales bacterium]|nr:MAG: response regulator [Gemmatimonadales bacterium]